MANKSFLFLSVEILYVYTYKINVLQFDQNMKSLLSFSQLSHIESALRSHYRVQDSRVLGLGTLHMLAGLVKRQRGLSGGGLSPVYYESALFAKHCKSRLALLSDRRTDRQTGCLSENLS